MFPKVWPRHWGWAYSQISSHTPAARLRAARPCPLIIWRFGKHLWFSLVWLFSSPSTTISLLFLDSPSKPCQWRQCCSSRGRMSPTLDVLRWHENCFEVSSDSVGFKLQFECSLCHFWLAPAFSSPTCTTNCILLIVPPFCACRILLCLLSCCLISICSVLLMSLLMTCLLMPASLWSWSPSVPHKWTFLLPLVDRGSADTKTHITQTNRHRHGERKQIN